MLTQDEYSHSLNHYTVVIQQVVNNMTFWTVVNHSHTLTIARETEWLL